MLAPRFLHRFVPPLLALATVLLPAHRAEADDWPQFRGPSRNGISAEVGITNRFREDGPPVAFRVPVSQGFSEISVHGDRLYTLEARGMTPDGRSTSARDPSELTSDLVVLDAESGREIWRREIGEAFADPRGSGPRSTPVITGERIFVLGEQGRVVSFTLDGTLVWSRDLIAELGGELPLWGYSSSVLVLDREDGRRLAVVAGGGTGRAVAAFDAGSGELVWAAGDGTAGYASPVEMTLAGTRQVVVLLGDRVSGFALDGAELWSHPWPVINNINVATPLAMPGDRVFVATSYDVGSTLLQIVRDGSGFRVEEVWRTQAMRNHFHMSIPHQGHLYGFDNAMLECLDAETGEVVWRHRGLGKGSLVWADGKLIVLSERGRLLLVEPTPTGFRELASHQILNGRRSWTAPSLADGQLYLRDETELVRLDLSTTGSMRANDQVTEAAPPTEPPAVSAAPAAQGWEGVESFQLRGRLNRNGYLMDLVLTEARDGRIRLEKHYGGRVEIFLWSDGRGWLKGLRDDGYSPLPPDQAWARRGEAESYARFPDFFRSWPEATWSGEEETVTTPDGRPARRLVTRPAAGRDVEWYFDPSSGQLLYAARPYLDPEDDTEYNAFMRYWEYRPVASGQVLPHYIEWDEGGTFLLTLELVSFEVDPELDEGHFTPPERPPSGSRAEAGSTPQPGRD